MEHYRVSCSPLYALRLFGRHISRAWSKRDRYGRVIVICPDRHRNDIDLRRGRHNRHSSAGYAGIAPGARPESPGVYHHVKYDARTWRTIFDVTYTIDENLTRKVISAAAG